MKSFIIKKDRYYILISLVSLLIIWKIIAEVINSGLILPTPEDTFIGLYNIITGKSFLLIILSSLKRGVIGFLISMVLGIIFGLISGLNRYFYRLFEPILIILRSTPLMSIILIALIWFNSDNVPVFASFLISFPIICSNVIEGTKNVDHKLIEMAKVYNIRAWRILKDIYFPSILPFLIAAISTAAGIGWKAVIAAEVLSQPEYALGTSLQDSRIYLDIEKVFAWTIIAILISYLFEKIIRYSQRYIVKWKYTNES